ncbi:MAG TPA: beta-ketoacyl-[acyl-carrier-protein] synthase II [Nitrospirae bacterium]|nr:3-oxoacyl-[acyl-carrier-protein] synthase 2 [bacterium BMS3Abin10]GBE39151.1 3-oxoacyl-[acyl-carrier-protein] synthase 2 [bacterium BMS3Bbin08]HDH51640.1 beta-ketoacyl-[acyl-carrier-protein] synthase II [Nitrospirota bacterium]HDK82079.1 beta-ketoacyl-[acyl-carrier-protein] synthase II [Nitrospirota bacterium]
MKKRVVVTGLGMVTPLGTGTEKSWNALLEGRSGIRKITQFDASDFASRIAGEVPDFEIDRFIEIKEQKKMDRFIHLGLAASVFAMEDSGLKVTKDNAGRVGVLIGSGIGGLTTIQKYHKILLEKGPRRITPFFIPMLIINLIAGQVSIRFGAKGPNSSVATACASGSHSIGDAFRIIQRGEADAMIAGGAEAVINALAIGGFTAMRALSTRNDEPEKASRPFDKDRDGFVMGEGSGILILEEMEFALKRGAKIYAEMIGYGMTGDAYHITTPSPDGDGAARCMKAAINDSRISPDELSYINAHGTSTKYNDELETGAIKRVFGEHAYKLAVSSTKSMTGHLLGASGGVEAVISVLSIFKNIVPPTVNLTNPDPECDLDYVPHKAREMEVNIVMSNSFGFGGTNACIIFRKYPAA